MQAKQDKMPQVWKDTTLGEVCSKITDGSHYSPKEKLDSSYLMASVKDMTDNGFNLETCKRISKDDFQLLVSNDCKPLINDVLIAKDGSYLKHTFVIKDNIDLVVLSSIAILRPNINEIDPTFLNYILINPYFKRYVEDGFVSGSVLPRIVLKDFKKIDIQIPPLPEQRAIAAILSSLDDKLELLWRQNKTLESIARTIFKEWFVKDKNWDGHLSEYIKVQGGYAFKSKDFKKDGVAGIIKITNIKMDFVDISNTQFVDKDIVKNIDEYKFRIKGGDFLIAMTGAEIGKIGIVEDTRKQIWVNQRVGKLVARILYGDIFGYLALRSREGQAHITDTASGSAQANISSTGIEEMACVPYSKKDVNSFGEKVKPLFEKIAFNFSQIQTLSRLRNTLLPKLMKREIRVKS